ncbi:MAG: COX15/CtaA family protein [Pseudomonadales bacterium]
MALFNSPENRVAGFKLALIATIFAVFVLGLGAFTRLMDAGLGCPDWPTCYGHVLWPETAEEVDVANQAFPDMPVEQDKTWPEMVHRYFAESLGLLTIAIFVIAVRRQQPQQQKQQPITLVSSLLLLNIILTVATIVYGVVMEPYAVSSVALTMLVLAYLGMKNGCRASPQPFKLPAFILAFIILQGLFGMWTVTLKLWPQVVTAHLLGGFTTFSLLWLLTLRLNNQPWQVSAASLQQLQRFRVWTLLGLIIVVLQVALGGWTTSNYAAVACPDLPTCQGQWLPAMNFSQGFNVIQRIGPNYLGGTMDNEARIAVHFSHRVGAIVTACYLLIVVALLFNRIAIPETRRMAHIIFAVLGLQIALGLGNIIFKFPVTVAVGHNLVGALLVVTMVTLNYRVFTARRG